jgi:hypothetical protein
LISDELSQTAPRLEVGNICFVPAQIALELPQIAFHRGQPRLDAIETRVIEKDPNQDQ